MIIDLPWQGKNVPCAILDVIRGCNAHCPFCYNQDEATVKPLATVLEEIETLSRLRRLQALMVSGGEPLLHPNILEIVSAIRDRGLVAIVLSNGILIDPERARLLKNAGCKLCYLHVQAGQRRPDLKENAGHPEAWTLMRAKAKNLVEAGIRAGCCFTLRSDDTEGIARECAEYFATPELTNILITTARAPEDFDRTSCGDMPISELLSRFEKIGLSPFASLSGVIDKRQRRWFSFQVVEARKGDGIQKGRICLRASWGECLAMRLLRLIKGHYDFTLPPPSSLALRVRLVLNALTGGRFVESLKMALRPDVRLSFRNVALDVPPYRLPDGRIEHCEDCPGAILKHGKLRPLCLSDIKLPEEEQN